MSYQQSRFDSPVHGCTNECSNVYRAQLQGNEIMGTIKVLIKHVHVHVQKIWFIATGLHILVFTVHRAGPEIRPKPTYYIIDRAIYVLINTNCNLIII